MQVERERGDWARCICHSGQRRLSGEKRKETNRTGGEQHSERERGGMNGKEGAGMTKRWTRMKG